MSIYSLSTRTLEGDPTELSDFSGQVTLIVNVASACGKTPQYAGLERLYQKYKGRGFSVLGFPSNDFGRQEPGTPQQIREFCSTKYRVTFPMFEKIRTKSGSDQSPVYGALGQAAGELPNWNFGKYLVGKNGEVVRYFAPNVDPEDSSLVQSIEMALAASAAP
ncbi:MAG TPA: glutathione peroxidase [Polyangiaceae bacterium]